MAFDVIVVDDLDGVALEVRKWMVSISITPTLPIEFGAGPGHGGSANNS